MSRNPVSLKQRLAALAAGPSSPSAPGQAPATRPTHAKRRSLFAAPWAKRNGHADGFGGAERERDILQEVMGRMIYQAGVDYECVLLRAM
jgi:Rho GTPase-activating protein 1